MARIGVFICHCGINIASTVDVEKVTQVILDEPNVVFATNYHYMCSTPGQQSIVDSIREYQLDRVLVASCSPRMHEVTFRAAAAKAGLNPHMCEMANIREQCSWVHEDRDQATQKALETIRAMLAKLAGDTPLEVTSIPVTKRALVVGAGIAGIQAALDITACIGGHMAQLSATFPTLDCSSCIYPPNVV
jgi:heterodisulfide reductase subunit A